MDVKRLSIKGKRELEAEILEKPDSISCLPKMFVASSPQPSLLAVSQADCPSSVAAATTS